MEKLPFRKMKYVGGNIIEYEVRPLVHYTADILKKKPEPVEFPPKFDLMFVVYSCVESMGYHGGIGLSANQIGFDHRIFTTVASEGNALFFINPQIIEVSHETNKHKEGCLSYPGLFLNIERPASVRLRFNDISGQTTEETFDGLTARVILHEMDHMEGNNYTRLVSPTELSIAKGKVSRNLHRIKRNLKAYEKSKREQQQ